MAGKIISASDSSATAWVTPEVSSEEDALTVAQERARHLDSIKQEVEAIKRQAYEEGLEKGRQEGMAQAQKTLDDFKVQFATLMNSFTHPIDQLNEVVETELVDLSVAVARQIVRRELKTDPAQVIGVVKEAISVLPSGVQHIKVFLNPADAQLVTDAMLSNVDEQKWQVVEDPVMERGGCRIETESSTVDATIDTRIAAIAARILGGERTSDE